MKAGKWFVLSLALLLVVGLTAQASAQSPGIVAFPTLIDFGYVEPGMSKTDTLCITNVGFGTLTLSEIRSPSPPFSISPPASPVGVAPGDTLY